MDCEKLITLVREKKYLWDQKEPQYHMRNVTSKLWEEVAAEMKEPIVEVKRKWKSLRDSFRRELKKCYEDKSGKRSETIRSWSYFNQMCFLMDFTTPKKSQLSIEESSNNSEDEEDIVDSCNSGEPSVTADDVQSDNEGCNNESNGPHSPLPALYEHPKDPKDKKKQIKRPLKRKRKIDNDEELIEIENPKLHFTQEAANNRQESDFLFLASLVPYLSEVPNHKKLKIRAEILNVLIREQEERMMD